MGEYNKYDALAREQYIEDIASCEQNLEIFHRLKENNAKFDDIRINSERRIIQVDCSNFGPAAIRQLSLALGGCNISLKRIELSNNHIGDGQFVDTIAPNLPPPFLQRPASYSTQSTEQTAS